MTRNEGVAAGQTAVYRRMRAGISETWLMNLPDDRIEAYHDLAPEGYRSITLVPRDGAVTPLAFPAGTIRCAELLP